ncbi:MAG: MarR family transcriptional regulator [Candidatus Margulisbacteria bacterium]|nr:MarR family transcriptional regulator [Candidatus Margulisiibacteriota bacterium]
MQKPGLETVSKEFEELLRLAHRTFFSSGSLHLHDADITIQQFIVMTYIYQKSSPKMTDLAEELGVTVGNMTAMVERLVKQGYLIRSGDSQDRRVVRISLTAKGKRVLNKVKELKQKKMRFIINKITVEDRAVLGEIIHKLISALKQEKEAFLK